MLQTTLFAVFLAFPTFGFLGFPYIVLAWFFVVYLSLPLSVVAYSTAFVFFVFVGAVSLYERNEGSWIWWKYGV